MSLSRKDFLKMAVAGGFGVVFGGPGLIPSAFADRGARLVTVKRRSLVMGSVVSFEVVAESEEAGYEGIRKALDRFRTTDVVFSMYKAKSEMGRLSIQAGKKPVTLSKEARTVLEFARKVSRVTGGLFDVTVEPAMKEWGFRTGPEADVAVPTESELRELERIVGYEKLQLDSGRAMLAEPGMAIDTGGIAGGYALDRAIEALKRSDVAAAFINFSGDIHCFGKPLSGTKWKVHIMDPVSGIPLAEAVLLEDEALSTSGAYQNRRNSNGSSWGHLLNALSACPIEPVGSVTAIHPSAMVADAWSTARYVGAETPADVRTIIL